MSCERQVKTMPPGIVLAALVVAGEVAEEERSLRRAVVGVGLAQGVRIDAQPLDVAGREGIVLAPVPRRVAAGAILVAPAPPG